jgi:hypothetical protein
MDRHIGELAVTIMNDICSEDLDSRTSDNGMSPSRPRVALIAEARMAAQFLERAADWAADVDRESVAEMVMIHRRLLDKISTLYTSPRPGAPSRVRP